MEDFINDLINSASNIPFLGWIFLIFLFLLISLLLINQKIMNFRKYIFLIYKNKNKLILEQDELTDIKSKNSSAFSASIYVNLNTVLQFPYVIDSGSDNYIFSGEYWGWGNCIVANENFNGSITFDNVHIKVFSKKNENKCYALYIKGKDNQKNISLIDLKLIGENFFETASKYSSIKLEKGATLNYKGSGFLLALCGSLENFKKNLITKDFKNIKILNDTSTLQNLKSNESIIYENIDNEKNVITKKILIKLNDKKFAV